MFLLKLLRYVITISKLSVGLFTLNRFYNVHQKVPVQALQKSPCTGFILVLCHLYQQGSTITVARLPGASKMLHGACKYSNSRIGSKRIDGANSQLKCCRNCYTLALQYICPCCNVPFCHLEVTFSVPAQCTGC